MARFRSFGPLDNVLQTDGDTAFLRLNQRLRPDQLQRGEVAESINGRMDIDGSWQPRKGNSILSTSLATDEVALTIPFYVYDNVTTSTLSRSGDTITIDFGGPQAFLDGTVVGISGITGITPDPNGNRVITVVDSGAGVYSIDVSGATGTIGGTADVGAPLLKDSLVNAVYGSCLFSDPSDDNEEYIVFATNSKAVALKLSDQTETDIAYPAGITISSDVNMIQAFNYVFIFRDGLTALEWDGDFGGTPAFAKVANGNYTAPVYLNTSSNTVIADGVVTVSETAHGLNVGDTIYVIDNGNSTLNEDGTSAYTVATVPNANSFTFFAQVPDDATDSLVYSKRVPVGLGFTHMPAPPWAIYHQRRLWMPFNYTTTGTSGSEVITSRDIRDEIIASDILDQDTYDQIVNQFRIASGGADYVVGMQPFADDNLVVFNRNTIHIIAGVSGDLQSAIVKEITREVGCVARKTITQVGNQILFLSDNGIYSIDFGDLYNLRGASLPLSEPIQPLINRINPDYAENSVAIYHNNRYYIAVPLDSSMENNVILVYNFLNQGWESMDTVSAVGWNVRNLIRAGAGQINKLYAVNSTGGVHTLETRPDDSDVLATQIGESAQTYYIPSSLTTRQYTFGTIERKIFKRLELQAESSTTNVSDIDIEFVSENPDTNKTMSSLSDLLEDTLAIGEDATVRPRIGGVRGYGGQFIFTPTEGRPKIRTVAVTAQLTDMGATSKQ